MHNLHNNISIFKYLKKDDNIWFSAENMLHKVGTVYSLELCPVTNAFLIFNDENCPAFHRLSTDTE